MNPPFGTRRAGIDVIFLERALEVCTLATTRFSRIVITETADEELAMLSFST